VTPQGITVYTFSIHHLDEIEVGAVRVRGDDGCMDSGCSSDIQAAWGRNGANLRNLRNIFWHLILLVFLDIILRLDYRAKEWKMTRGTLPLDTRDLFIRPIDPEC
jgi:hypothetical protein